MTTTDTREPATSDEPAGAPDDDADHHRRELFEALLLALAALLTAWAAFQATKWGGVQANSFSQAGAQRTESVRASNLANRQTVIDVDSFTSWIDAIATEQAAGVDIGFADDGSYEPVAGTTSAFLYDRLRPEFRTAVDAWLETRPLTEAASPPTPFELPEYRNAAQAEAEALEVTAEELAATARQANQRGDNYVMMTIVFAMAIVLLGVAGKMRGEQAHRLLTGLATVAVLAGLLVLLTYPIEV
ncbi:MAG: hypothetical protein ACK5OX_11530 [Desertimonas sp.]